MNKREGIFIICVFVFALIFAAATIANFHEITFKGSLSGAQNTDGKARDLNMKVIEAQIGQGRLSDHEALFYKPANP